MSNAAYSQLLSLQQWIRLGFIISHSCCDVFHTSVCVNRQRKNDFSQHGVCRASSGYSGVSMCSEWFLFRRWRRHSSN